jgi:hypothetical protein
MPTDGIGAKFPKLVQSVRGPDLRTAFGENKGVGFGSRGNIHRIAWSGRFVDGDGFGSRKDGV